MKSGAKLLRGMVHKSLILAIATLITGIADQAHAQQSAPQQAADTAKPADPLFNQPYVDIDE